MGRRARKRKADSRDNSKASTVNYSHQTRAQQKALDQLRTPEADLGNNRTDHVHSGGAPLNDNGQSGSPPQVTQNTSGNMAELQPERGSNVVLPAAEVARMTTATAHPSNQTVTGTIQTGATSQNLEQQQLAPMVAGTAVPGEQVYSIRGPTSLINSGTRPNFIHSMPINYGVVNTTSSVGSISGFSAVVQNNQGTSPVCMGIRPTALVSVCEPSG